MKRAVLPLAVALAILLPSEALAGTSTLKGKLETTTGEGRVAFELKRKANGTRKVLHWRWRDLPIECAEGSRMHTGEFLDGGLRVSEERSFYGRGLYQENPNNVAEVSGSFPESWRNAEGTFEVSGDTSQGTGCKSGVVDWTARRR